MAASMLLCMTALAQEAPPVDWEDVMRVPVERLTVTSRGAVYAHLGSGGEVSYDSGATWQTLLSPALSAELVAVDPSNDAVLYFRAADGLYGTSDAGQTFNHLLATAAPLQLAVSPVDGQLLFLALFPSPASLQLARSTDRGINWIVLQDRSQSLCVYRVLVLEPDRSDAARVFRAAECYSGRSTGGGLAVSHDQGEHWSEVLRESARYPMLMVGGSGADPTRLYLSANDALNASASRGGSVFRSDDGGETWAEVLVVRVGEGDDGPLWIGGLASDPRAPDVVYASLAGVRRGLLLSCDGGTTWGAVTGQDIGDMTSLALTSDGAILLAATDRGVWRRAAPACGAPESVSGKGLVPTFS